MSLLPFVSRFLAAGILLALLTSPACRADEPPWVLVKGEGGGVAGRSWSEIVGFYPSGLFRGAVDIDEARRDADTHRFLVGAPAAHPLIAELGEELGLEVEREALVWRGRTIPRGTGLSLVVDDPDGVGLLAIYTGLDDASAWSCFTVSIDLLRKGYAIASEGKLLERGSITRGATSKTSVVRLDDDWQRLVTQAERESQGPAEAALRVARGIAGHRFVLEAALGNRLDLNAWVAERLAQPSPDIAAARAFADGFDLNATIAALHDRTWQALGRPAGMRPVYFVLYGAPPGKGTNARRFGVDPSTGRPAILLNLCDLAVRERFDVAVVHETVHAYQPTSTSRRLVDRAINEGVATLISEALCPDASDAAVFMTDSATLAAARSRRSKLISAFKRVAETTDPEVQGTWLQLGLSTDDVRGAPERSGYFVAWVAARAWLEADEARTLADLLIANPDDILNAL